MKFTLGILVLLVSTSFGCAPQLKTAKVYLAQGGGYGKAVFIVSPVVSKSCKVSVDTETGPKELDCNSEYIMSCDIDIPEDKPFCQLAREIGVDRESTYPKDRRQ
jgi:hypothetical protein